MDNTIKHCNSGIQYLIEQYEKCYLMREMRHIERGIEGMPGNKLSSLTEKIGSFFKNVFAKKKDSEVDFEKTLLKKYIPFKGVDSVKDIYINSENNNVRELDEIKFLRGQVRDKIEDLNVYNVSMFDKGVEMTLDEQIKGAERAIREFDKNLMNSDGIIDYDYIERNNLQYKSTNKNKLSG